MRVAICEDDESFIQAVAEALAGTDDLALVAIARTRAEAISMLGQPGADVLLVDLGLPDGSGIDVIRAAHSCWPQCLTLVSTVFGDEAHVIRSLEAGATGYLLKDNPAERIADEIRTVMAGGSPISPLIARRLLNRFGLARPAAGQPTPAPAGDKRPRLSRREQQVLELITKGFSYEEIAQLLQVSRNTVLSFVRRIYAKLDVSSQIQAIQEARNHGLIGP